MKTAAGILVGIFVTVCIAAYFQIGGLRLNLEIKPVELATFLVSAFIAVFLQYYLATQVNDRRSEKNLLIDNCRDALTILKSCRDLFWNCYESGKLTKSNKTSILGYLRSLANSLDSLESAVGLSQFSKLKYQFRPAKDAYFSYKNALTGSGFPARPYRNDALADHEKTYRDLNAEIQSLLFQINKQR
ncbi:MAG: hypothetical protein WD696_06600 [Bryobacteraceae bacterium]